MNRVTSIVQFKGKFSIYIKVTKSLHIILYSAEEKRMRRRNACHRKLFLAEVFHIGERVNEISLWMPRVGECVANCTNNANQL